VFEKRVLRRIFGPKSDEMVGGWRKLHNEFHDLFWSPIAIRMIKSRRMRWAGHVARIKFWLESQQDRDHKEDLDVGGRIIIRWILER
jgi:hypothetical protein